MSFEDFKLADSATMPGPGSYEHRGMGDVDGVPAAFGSADQADLDWQEYFVESQAADLAEKMAEEKAHPQKKKGMVFSSDATVTTVFNGSVTDTPKAAETV
jgi:hypothetical protein